MWHYWSRNDQVYAVHGNTGHVHKFSFHTPDVCRLAYTKEYGTPRALTNRATHEWRRDPTPDAGTGRVVRVLRVHFPTDVLSDTGPLSTKKSIFWVKPGPAGGAAVLDLMFTRDDESALHDAISKEASESSHELVAYKKLTNGEAFCITSWSYEGAQNTLRMPASHGQVHDIIIHPDDPNETGRPMRLVTFTNPQDGDLIQAWEFGAYKHPPLTDDEWEEMQ